MSLYNKLLVTAVFLAIGARTYAQEYIDYRFGKDAVEAKTVVTVDGVQLFIWNEETKEMAVKGNDHLKLFPPDYGIVAPEDARGDFEGASYSGDVVVPSHAEYNGTTYTVTRIAFGAFIKCPGLTSVTLPETITTFGAEAFYGCENLTHIELPANLDYINLNIFADCPSLKKIDFKNTNVIYPMDNQLNHPYIGGEFHFTELLFDSPLPTYLRYFPELEKVYFRSDDPYTKPDTDTDKTFLPGQLENVELIVPVGSGDTYRSRPPWSWFANIIEDDTHTTGISLTEIPDAASFRLIGNSLSATDKTLEVYTIVGVRTVTVRPGETVRLTPGVYIATDGIKASKIAIR